MNPRILRAYIESDNIKRQKLDEEMYILAQYICDSVSIAIARTIGGTKTEFIKEPYLKQYFEDRKLTPEEINKRELEKMIAAQEAWNREIKFNKSEHNKQSEV